MKLSVSTTVPRAVIGLGLIDKDGVQYYAVRTQGALETKWYTISLSGSIAGVTEKEPTPPVLLIRN